MIRRCKLLLPAVIIWVLPFSGWAQQFNYAVDLDQVDSNGFYMIPVFPGLTAYTRTDFADIRIADKNKQWVPHILQQGSAVLQADSFTLFPILQNTVTDSGKNLLVVENTKAASIFNLRLFLKNSAVSRIAQLSGSDNSHDWFIIDDKIAISRSYETVEDEYLQEISFPPARYRYLKLVIDNLRNDPLFITKAGTYAQPYNKIPASYQDDPVPVFTQTDSGNYSYIQVRQRNAYHLDKISLTVSGAKFYDRDLQISLPVFGKNNVATPGRVLGNFNLVSSRPAIFELPRTRAAVFYIVIKNADNPPLKVDQVTIQQSTAALVAYLEQGNKYRLMLGDSLAAPADYDLQAFRDSISGLRILHYGKLQAIKKVSAKDPTGSSNNWIWIAVVAAGIVLGILTLRLTRDINKQHT